MIEDFHNDDSWFNLYRYNHRNYRSIDPKELSESGLVNYYKIKHHAELEEIRDAQEYVRKYGIKAYKRYLHDLNEQQKRFITIFNKLSEERPMEKPNDTIWYQKLSFR